jgi:photosystem II stability/assembly factor-like uncharacterized protein
LDTAYVLSENGNLLKTTNGGVNWNSITNLGVATTDVNFINSNVGFILSNNGKIYKTIDSGASWNQISTGVTNFLKNSFFTSIDTGFVVGNLGVILKTTDSGDNWSVVFNDNSFYYLNAISFINNDIGFAVGGEGNDGGRILKTIDGGLNWNIDITGAGNVLFDIDFTANNIGFVSGNYGALLKNTSEMTASLNSNANLNSGCFIYPNPAANKLYIQVDKKSDISIYRITGQCIFNINGAIGLNEVNTALLSNGTYLIYIDTNGNKKVERLIIDK